MNEFDFIEHYFEPLTMGREEAGGLKDDAAVFKIPAGYDLVVTSDTLNIGTHFIKDETPENIAHKALRVNLSDLAAMGAEPLSYQLNLVLPSAPEKEWMERFTGALYADQQAFGVFCSGGDTTLVDGVLSISITALGLVPAGKAVRRSGAQDGDLVVMTGPIGNAYVGLRVLLELLSLKNAEKFTDACSRPYPRTALVQLVREYAHAAADISDGFVADLGHIAKASGCLAEVDLSRVLLSPEVQALVGDGKVKLENILSGGDDYELLLAVPEARWPEFEAKARVLGVFPQAIGRFKAGKPGVRLLDENGKRVSFSHTGWSHF